MGRTAAFLNIGLLVTSLAACARDGTVSTPNGPMVRRPNGALEPAPVGPVLDEAGVARAFAACRDARRRQATAGATEWQQEQGAAALYRARLVQVAGQVVDVRLGEVGYSLSLVVRLADASTLECAGLDTSDARLAAVRRGARVQIVGLMVDCGSVMPFGDLLLSCHGWRAL